jgi:Flp pilus assembly protein TadG
VTGGSGERGAATIFFTIFLLTVVFGMMVFAVDYGRIYLIQGELQTAADAAALAAANHLVGTGPGIADVHAADGAAASLDNTTGNDNRFNMRINQIGAGAVDLVTETLVDFFSTRFDAVNNVNGGKTGSEAKYARVQITAQAPVLFPQFLNIANPHTTNVVTAAVAGISSPICAACGIEPIAVTALDTTDESDYGFVRGDYYTLYLTPSQQSPNITGCLATTPTTPLDSTDAVVEYSLLSHFPSGPATDADGTVFEISAGTMSQDPTLDPPGTITIGSTEAVISSLQGTDCADAIPAGRDVICGFNTRFGVDPTSNECAAIASVTDIAPSFSPDTDPATGLDLQDYSTEYDGNSRRVITVAVIDSVDTVAVLNFRQFFIVNSPNSEGLDTTTTSTVSTGSIRAQYIGMPVPLHCGGVGGACQVTYGVGRTVLH